MTSVTYQRILITRMKFIGDVVLTTPVVRSVREACPGAYIAYMGEKNAVSLLEQNPNVDEIIAFDFARPTVVEQTRVAVLLRKRKFDLAIDLFGNPRSALLTFLSGAPRRIGMARPGRGRLYTIQVRDDGRSKSAIEFHNQFIMAAGITPSSAKTEIVLSADERRKAASLLETLGIRAGSSGERVPVVGIHPGATWPAKRWLPERFAELATRLMEQFNCQVIMTAGPNDAEAVKAVLGSARSGVVQIPVLPLREVAAILSQCEAFVSNDAGPMHIAVALGVPTIGLFGPGEENIWFPYGADEGHVALRRDVPCHPCHLDFCNRQGTGFMECMFLLDVDAVLTAVDRALGLRSPQFHR